jgi:hypothetical protein
MDWEKIFANYTSGKWLLYKLQKVLTQLNSKTKPMNNLA